jgi:5-methylcytosine-specific restriction endonuclease McrA
MKSSLKRKVRRLSRGRCEYCGIPESATHLPFQFDHIIATSHGGESILGNIAYSCLPCNKHKGPNLSGIDPKTKKIVPLFHPRRQNWQRHFRWRGPFVRGRTPTGRATVAVLHTNEPVFVAVRLELIDEGILPPEKK